MSDDLDNVFTKVLGYLNFSGGKPDPAFPGQLDLLAEHCGFHSADSFENACVALRETLLRGLAELNATSGAFSDTAQAQAVIPLVLDRFVAAYCQHHSDLLFHLDPSEYLHPYLLARCFEAVLQQGGPWDETARVVDGALDQMNDFLGYRPLAVLENNRKMTPYEHERYRPTPLFIAGSGVSRGRHREVIEQTLSLLDSLKENTPPQSHFSLDRMDELALDVRAYDHDHPVFKRTNYLFGEWDPHVIDGQGHFRRFVIRKIIVDALVDWVEVQEDKSEAIFDAGAVLCGTILMASSISGDGPACHDSNVTLSTLLPIVARQRDDFYVFLMNSVRGERAARLAQVQQITQQPFGHVRQALNLYLAHYGARQVQYRHLASIYARMGHSEAARDQADSIPSTSARFECEIQWRITSTRVCAAAGDVDGAETLLAEIEDCLHRGIRCGALVDPWNVLGFQGNFPLFSAREDSIPDQRVEILLDLMERTFGAFSETLSAAAALGRADTVERIAQRFENLATYWDQFAAHVIEDLPHVFGRESLESARHVAEALAEWRAAGEAAGDISFWRKHVSRFTSAKSYAVVVEALLGRNDYVAAMALLVQWLSCADDVGIESGPYSIHAMLLEWMQRLVKGEDGKLNRPVDWNAIKRLFDFLEANAGEYWDVPHLDAVDTTPPAARGEAEPEETARDDDWYDESDEESRLFEAAYENIVFRDSADDGFTGEVHDGGFDAPGTTEFEIINRELEPRIKFIMALAQLWQIAAAAMSTELFASGSPVTLDASAVSRDGEPDAAAGEAASDDAEPEDGASDEVAASDPSEAGGDAESDQAAAMVSGKGRRTKKAAKKSARRKATRRALAPNPVVPEADVPEPEISSEQRDVLRAWLDRIQQLQAELLALMNSIWSHEIDERGGDHDANVEYDIQLQTKFYLLNTIIATHINCRVAEVGVMCLLPEGAASKPLSTDDQEMVRFYRAVMRQDIKSVQQQLGRQFRRLAQRPLLYVPLDNGGHPNQILAARTNQTDIRFLLKQLPRLGLYRETWHVVRLAYRMERESRPGQMAVTEFDRMFRTGLRNTIECLIESSRTWNPKGRLFPAENLVELILEITRLFRDQWFQHSRTMRLSSVESLRSDTLWESVCEFIERFGDELFHARFLTLGNVRTILHNGIEWFLAQIAEHDDPLHPSPLIAALEAGEVDPDDVIDILEIIYGSVVDRFDRFLEYNTTTTQSDYGSKFHVLLDFLRVESAYDRDAWERIPEGIVHRAVAMSDMPEIGRNLEAVFEDASREDADEHLANLSELEDHYGVHLPAISDRLNERFVKPLAVNRILSLIKPSMKGIVAGGSNQADNDSRFQMLRDEIDSYMETSAGSAVDIPQWLQDVEREVNRQETPADYIRPPELELHLPAVTVTEAGVRAQLEHWGDAISGTSTSQRRRRKATGRQKRTDE